MSFFSSLKTLLLTTAIVLCCSTPSFAAPVFSAETIGPTIKGSLSGTSFGDGPFLMFFQTTPFLPLDTGGNPSVLNSVAGFSISGDTTSFNVDKAANTLYYVRAVGKVGGANYISPSVQVTTGEEIRAEKLVFEEPSSDCKSIYIKGKILTANRKDYEIILKYYNTYEQGTEPHEAKAQHGRGTQANFGIAEDGSYDFYLSNLTTGNTKYFVTQTIRNPKTGAVATEQGEFFSCKGNIAGTTTESDDFNKRSYRFLAPISIPGLGTNLELLLDHDLCLEQAGADAAKQNACNNQIGDFINLILRVLISFAAVFLVVQIIIKGYQYMVTDIPKFKINAKERVFEAFGGLLLALSSYLILNTINPRLLTGTIGIDTIELSVNNFEISGAGSYDGKPIKIDFNKKAYPAAFIASQKTGVSEALILAVFGQETGSGRNVGRCFINDAKANMYDEDKVALKTIVSELVPPRDINTTPVSCAAISNGVFDGHGGAIGYTQFRPVTWLAERIEAKGYLGKTPNPWSLDAIMVEAVYLKKLGALTNQKEAACKYFSGPGGYCAKKQSIENYGAGVMGKKLSLEKQIAEAKAKGELCSTITACEKELSL